MSHDQTTKKQAEMGKSYDAKILSWKHEVKSRELWKKKLLSEAKEKQSGEPVVDMSRATLQEHSNFSSKGFNSCVTLLEEQSALSGQAAAKHVKKILAKENPEIGRRTGENYFELVDYIITRYDLSAVLVGVFKPG